MDPQNPNQVNPAQGAAPNSEANPAAGEAPAPQAAQAVPDAAQAATPSATPAPEASRPAPSATPAPSPTPTQTQAPTQEPTTAATSPVNPPATPPPAAPAQTPAATPPPAAPPAAPGSSTVAAPDALSSGAVQKPDEDYVPQYGVNENPATQAATLKQDELPAGTACPVPERPLLSKKSIIVGLIILAAIIIVIILFFVLRGSGEVSQPAYPDLSSSGNTLRGFMRSSEGFYIVTEDVRENWAGFDEDCVETVMTPGYYLYYLNQPATIEDIMTQLIKPITGNEYLLTFYSPGESALDLREGQYSYPKGPLADSILLDFTQKIPANRGFGLIVKQETMGCLRNSEAPPLGTFTVPLTDEESGWILLPVGRCSDLAPYSNLITEVMSQNGPDSFVPATTNDCLHAEYHFNWLSISGGDKPMPASMLESEAVDGVESEGDTILDDVAMDDIGTEVDIEDSGEGVEPEILTLTISHGGDGNPINIPLQEPFTAFADTSVVADIEYRIFRLNDLDVGWEDNLSVAYENDNYVFREAAIEVQPGDASRQLIWNINPETTRSGGYVIFAIAYNEYGTGQIKFLEFELLNTQAEEIEEIDEGGEKVLR